jgi:E3 ubiquitin-protein ligase BRE1
MNEDLFHLKEGLDRLERQTHRLQLAKKQQELNEAQMEIDLNNNNDNNILKIENYTSPLNSPMKKKKNNNNNNNNKHLILENNNHMDAQVNIEEQGQITLEDELKQLISEVEIKQEEIDKLREHLINTMKQIRESKMTDSIGAVESAAVTTNLYSSFYKKMTDSQNRFTAFFGEWQKQASNLLEYREKRYAEKESNRKRLKAKKSEHEAVIMQSEVKLKQVQAEKEKISYETEFLKSKIPRAQVVDLLTSQISLLTNMWEKQYENIKFLEMEIDETNHLIEEKKKSIDPTSLEKMSKEKMKIVKEAQIEFEKLMDELQIAREKEYELRDLELKNISKFLKSENAMETEIFNERSTTSLTESERELNNDKLQSQIYELRNKIKNAYEPSILLKDYQNEFPQERDTKESDTSLLEEINWHIQQIKYYERRLKSAKEEGERKTEEMNILSKNFISIQSENESILKQMQLCEDKSMSLASDTLTLDQTVTATQKKIDVAQEKIRKMELKNDELDNQLHQSRGVVNHLEERVERYDADIKTQQLKFAKCYIPIKDFYLSCSDFIQKIKKHQEELEKLRKLKSPENDRQLKEEKTTTSSLNSECNILKKKLEGYSKNLLRTSSGINEGGNKQEELEKYKSMVRCSVCTDRQKDTVLTTCFHVFCKSCLESNLASRHRKCPGCNIPFDRPNMRSISL